MPVRIRPAWRCATEADRARVLGFWERHRALPSGADPQARLDQLAALAWADDILVGVCSAGFDHLAQLGVRLAFVREFVAPEWRVAHVGLQLFHSARAAIERWSLDHPEEEVMGLGGVVRSQQLAEWAERPVWPPSGLDLVGYSGDGCQIRVRWFDHARVSL